MSKSAVMMLVSQTGDLSFTAVDVYTMSNSSRSSGTNTLCASATAERPEKTMRTQRVAPTLVGQLSFRAEGQMRLTTWQSGSDDKSAWLLNIRRSSACPHDDRKPDLASDEEIRPMAEERLDDSGVEGVEERERSEVPTEFSSRLHFRYL